MKKIRTTFFVCCLLVFREVLQAVPSQGYVIEWGWNTSAGTAAPAKQVLGDATVISAGRLHCLALKSDGTVVQWGGNFRGEASFDNTVLTTGESGFGNTVEIKNTTRIVTNGVIRINGQVLSNSVSIAAGDGFSLALKQDGTIVAWGDQERIEAVPTNLVNNAGETFTIDPTTGLPVHAGGGEIRIDPVTGLPVRTKDDTIPNSFKVGLANDGTVVTRVEDKEPTPLSNIIAIAAAGFTSVAVKGDGTVLEWESAGSLPQHGQLRVMPGLSNVVAVAVSEGSQNVRPVALKKDGTVANWGGESIYKDATPPAGLSNVVAIAVGSSHTLALKSDGTIVGWGWNKVGEATGTPTTNSPNGLDFFAAGQVQIRGQTLSNVVSIAAGHGYSLAVKSDGTMVAWGRMVNDLYPANVPAGLSNVVAIAAGYNFCLAITTNKTIADKFTQ